MLLLCLVVMSILNDAVGERLRQRVSTVIRFVRARRSLSNRVLALGAPAASTDSVGRVWALPFLSVLVPSQRYYQERKRQHKPVLKWAKQMVGQVRRWLPNRKLVRTADSTYAGLDFLSFCQRMRKPVKRGDTLARGRGLVRPNTSASGGTTWPTVQKGRTASTIGRSFTRSNHGLNQSDGCPVWTNPQDRAPVQQYGALVSQRLAASKHSLGTDNRSAWQVQTASLAVQRHRRGS